MDRPDPPRVAPFVSLPSEPSAVPRIELGEGKRAQNSGITGQGGSYLADLFLAKGRQRSTCSAAASAKRVENSVGRRRLRSDNSSK
jgi:hypothetical protein